VVLTSTLTATSASAQPPPRTHDQAPSITVAYEWHRDRLRYSFDTPSSFDTAFLVPHSYTQTYRADNHWGVARARYELLDARFTSEFGVTAPVATRASDIDTFYNPDGDVITSGTDGPATMHSWRFAQRTHGHVAGIPVRVGYALRRDYADFHPADIVVTHTRPPSTSRRFTTDQEFTTSTVQELTIDASHTFRPAAQWQLVGTLSGSPVVAARIATVLPQKYPGEVIRASAFAAAFAARLQAEAVSGTVRWVASVEWGRATGYQASRSFDRDALELSVGVTWP
jgi:hypothetical protein